MTGIAFGVISATYNFTQEPAEMVTKSILGKTSRKKVRQPIFEGIRKPLAPPGHPLSHAKPDAKARPAGRKAKHKRKPEQAVELEEVE